jgi:hypothetical protein
MSPTARRTSPLALTSALAVLALLVCRIASANPVPGFIEHWGGGTTATWGGGDFYANPGAGGQLGAGDGFLQITTPGPAQFFSTNLGSMSTSADFSGNWQAAGITTAQFWLRDVGNPDPLEMHFAIGNGVNFWQYDPGFIPPSGSWAKFTVDLTSAAGWTQIINGGPGSTFNSALQNVDRILIRHDHAPFVQPPDSIRADVGVDELTLLSGGSTAVPHPANRPVSPVSLSPPYPNPSSGAVMCSIESFDESPVRIDIVDASGRLVRREALAGAGPGVRSWSWDGRTDAGVAVAAGVYRIRAYSASGGTSRSLVRIGRTR